MSNRVTQHDLEQLLGYINEISGFGKNPEYSTPGSFDLSFAYGGVKLVKYTSNGGAIREISHDGYGTKRQLYEFMYSFLSQLEQEKARFEKRFGSCQPLLRMKTPKYYISCTLENDKEIDETFFHKDEKNIIPHRNEFTSFIDALNWITNNGKNPICKYSFYISLEQEFRSLLIPSVRYREIFCRKVINIRNNKKFAKYFV